MGIYTRVRILSILALLLLLGIGVVGVLLVITNPALTLVYVISGTLLVLGIWISIRSAGKRWWWGIAVTVLALLGALMATGIFFFQPKNALRLLILAGLSCMYLAVVGVIARYYWRARRQSVRSVSLTGKKPVLIINPKSGNGRALRGKLAEHAAGLGVHVIVMKPGQDMVRLAEQAIAAGADVLGISGGDGSLGVMAKVAMDHDLPLVVLPGGTRCHFARDIGLSPDRISDALAGFRGVERRVDVGMLGERVFLNNASFGLYAEIAHHADYREHKLETSRRVMRELALSDSPFYPLTFKDGIGTIWHHAALVLVGVNHYEIVHVGELGERKNLDGGVFQVLALTALDGHVLKQLTTHMRHRRDEDSPFAEWDSTAFAVSHASGWVNVGIDGESVRVPSPAHMRLIPKGLRLLVPAEGIRHRPVKPISAAGTKTLWGLIKGTELA